MLLNVSTFFRIRQFVKIAACRDVGIRGSKSTNRFAVLKVLNVGCKGRGDNKAIYPVSTQRITMNYK